MVDRRTNEPADAPGKRVRPATSRTSGSRRIEIAHESLLREWPRLVRWQTQDEEGALLRDQLRQAAQLWEERGRPEDLLWTGTSFREYQLWRERYSGGLSDREEEFSRAMRSRATRRRRRRRLAVGAVIAVTVGVATVTGLLWRRSEAALAKATAAEAQALSEARRAEASKLLALAQLELDADATAALAYATRSLELADTPEARLFALRALSIAPPARVLEVEERVEVLKPAFSPDGAWMSMSGHRELRVAGREGSVRLLDSFPSVPGYISSAFSTSGDTLFALNYADGRGETRMWSVPGFEPKGRHQFDAVGDPWLMQAWSTSSGYGAAYIERVEPFPGGGTGAVFQTFAEDGDPERSVRLANRRPPFGVDDALRWIVQTSAGDPRALVLRPLSDSTAPPRLLGRHDEPIGGFIPFTPDGRFVTASDRSREIRVWSVEAPGAEPVRTFHGRGHLEEGWRWRVWDDLTSDGYRIEVWDMSAPAEALPLSWLTPGPIEEAWEPRVSPDGRWLTTVHAAGRALWPLSRRASVVLPIPGEFGDATDMDVAFTRDGGRLVSVARAEMRSWDLHPGGKSRALASDLGTLRRVAIGPEDRFAIASSGKRVVIVPLDGGAPRELESGGQTWALALDAEGRRVAAASWMGDADTKAIRIFDLASGTRRSLPPVEGAGEGFTGRQSDFEFLPDERLVSVGDGGLRLWDLEAGPSEVLAPSASDSRLAVFDEGRHVAYWTEAGRLVLTDLETRETRELPTHGNSVSTVAVDPEGTLIVSGSDDGTIRVGPLTGEEPHLLLGHTGSVKSVAISPDGRRIASIAFDDTLRVWPMPDVSKPPMQSLDHDQLLAELHGFTNVRVVEDEDNPTGWAIDYTPFPGWQVMPEW